MEWHTAVRQLLLFIHLLAFALAISDVLREDWHLLAADQFDRERLAATARRLTWALAALWVTGLMLIALDIGLDWRALAAKPKLLTKLFVVVVLTVNGGLLHHLAFPALRAGAAQARRAATLAALLGAVSTVSWLFASFTGAARIVAPYLRLPQFLAFYALALVLGIAVALGFVRSRLQRLLAGSDDTAAPAARESALLSPS